MTKKKGEWCLMGLHPGAIDLVNSLKMTIDQLIAQGRKVSPIDFSDKELASTSRILWQMDAICKN